MTVNVAGALSAYSKSAAQGPSSGLEARDTATAGKGFAELVKDTASAAIAVGKEGEAASMAAIAGAADLSEVVIAVTNAEVTLQTVVAIRDRVIQAYQDIIRMPL